MDSSWVDDRYDDDEFNAVGYSKSHYTIDRLMVLLLRDNVRSWSIVIAVVEMKT
jgi:hypothetical protein